MQLQERERNLVMFGGMCFIVYLIYLLGIAPVSKKLSRMERDLDRQTKQLAQIAEQKETFLASQEQIKEWEQKMVATSTNSLSTLLDIVAKKTNIQDRQERIDPRTVPANDFYKEEAGEIVFRSISPKELVTFLLEIENHRNLLIIRRLQIKTDTKDRDILREVRIYISAFKKQAPA